MRMQSVEEWSRDLNGWTSMMIVAVVSPGNPGLDVNTA
jgi:hypothetical protein